MTRACGACSPYPVKLFIALGIVVALLAGSCVTALLLVLIKKRLTPEQVNDLDVPEDDEEQGWRDILAHEPTPEDTVVGIASSGTTPYVVGALRRAREFGMLTASVSSNPSSPLAAEADFPIDTVVGAEFVTGSSRMKSGTAQKLVCNMISTAAMIRLGRVQGNRMVNMQLSNRKLVDRGTRMIVDQTGMPYERARRLLLLHGSVRRALDALREGKE